MFVSARTQHEHFCKEPYAKAFASAASASAFPTLFFPLPCLPFCCISKSEIFSLYCYIPVSVCALACSKIIEGVGGFFDISFASDGSLVRIALLFFMLSWEDIQTLYEISSLRKCRLLIQVRLGGKVDRKESQTGMEIQTGRKVRLEGKSDWKESQTGRKVRLEGKSDWKESQSKRKVRLEAKLK